MNYFANKRVLITGGTSGLGRALAIQLHHMGAKVGILARGQAQLDDMTRQFPGIYALQADVSNKHDIYPAAGSINSELGGLDILFNAASELGPTPLRLLMDSDCEDFEQVLQTNLLGPFRLTKALVPSMLLAENGLVVNISSDAAIHAYPGWGLYSVSKAALDHLTRLFDEELKSSGVRFLAIDPGDMHTPMHLAAVPDADVSELRHPDESARKILSLIASQDFSQIRRSV